MKFIKVTLDPVFESAPFAYLNLAAMVSIQPGVGGAGGSRIVVFNQTYNTLDSPEYIVAMIDRAPSTNEG